MLVSAAPSVPACLCFARAAVSRVLIPHFPPRFPPRPLPPLPHPPTGGHQPGPDGGGGGGAAAEVWPERAGGEEGSGGGKRRADSLRRRPTHQRSRISRGGGQSRRAVWVACFSGPAAAARVARGRLRCATHMSPRRRVFQHPSLTPLLLSPPPCPLPVCAGEPVPDVPGLPVRPHARNDLVRHYHRARQGDSGCVWTMGWGGVGVRVGWGVCVGGRDAAIGESEEMCSVMGGDWG